jgi:GxxExxY protein
MSTPIQEPPSAQTIMKFNEVSQAIIGAAIEVHRTVGPGLLESAYEECLAKELTLKQIPFERQKLLAVEYKGLRLDCGYRLDFLVANMVVVEIKAVDALTPLHEAQLLSYMKLGGWKMGLLINFHVTLLKNGLKRLVNGLEE